MSIPAAQACAIADTAVRRMVPEALRSADLSEQAATLGKLSPVVNSRSAHVAADAALDTARFADGQAHYRRDIWEAAVQQAARHNAIARYRGRRQINTLEHDMQSAYRACALAALANVTADAVATRQSDLAGPSQRLAASA